MGVGEKSDWQNRRSFGDAAHDTREDLARCDSQVVLQQSTVTRVIHAIIPVQSGLAKNTHEP